MREKDCDTWDLGQMHMGRSGQGVGTVPVLLGVHEGSIGEGWVLAGNLVGGTVWVVRVWGYGKFGPPSLGKLEVKRPQMTSSALEDSWKFLFLIIMYLLGKYCTMSPNQKFNPVAANDVQLEGDTKEDN
nr:hypothetical protein [Tanacetum cinerariifolium]